MLWHYNKNLVDLGRGLRMHPCIVLQEKHHLGCELRVLVLIAQQVPGALLSLGDAHTSQGDSELDGTAIETSLTATLKITLHKKGSLPKMVSKLNFPLLENANEFVVHGFTNNVRPLDLP